MTNLNGLMEKSSDIKRNDERYFRSLCTAIDYKKMKKDSGKDYSELLRYLYNREFYSKTSHDDNRRSDGLQLRIKSGVADYIPKSYCSVLEMLVAFCIRIDSDILPDYSPGKWFWLMMHNCGLDIYDNNNWDEAGANYILSLVNYRGYGKDGKGGYFPLKNPKEDQRKVELWYQMQSYILENFEC